MVIKYALRIYRRWQLRISVTGRPRIDNAGYATIRHMSLYGNIGKTVADTLLLLFTPALRDDSTRCRRKIAGGVDVIDVTPTRRRAVIH